MKAKFLLVAALLFTIPLFAGCNTDGADVSDVNVYTKDSSAIYSGQSEDISTSTAESTGEETEDISISAEDTSEIAEDISEVTVMYITINSDKLKVDLAQNTSVDALVDILKQGDIVYTADDYGNFEKVGSIGHSLPRNDENITTEPGDVILYQGSSICLYYGVNTWSFTRIGKINGYTTAELKSLLGAGSGSVEVILSLN